MRIDIAPELLNYFAASPLGPLFNVPELFHDKSHYLRERLKECLRKIPAERVTEMRNDANFRAMTVKETEAGLDEDARQAVLVAELNIAVARHRLASMAQMGQRPMPCGLPELCDLQVDGDGLVAMKDFDFNGSVLKRNGRAFLMAPSTESPNASYWFLLQAERHNLLNSLAIRLDPFMHGPADSFPNMAYFMWLYGRPLDWSRLADLKEPEHGRWMPSPSTLARGSAFTDFVWAPRGKELHFICEEVPSEDRVETRGGRYLHAVYDLARAEIVHFDGALRIYNPTELAARQREHVRSAGKVGSRVKLFRTDAALSRDCLADLAMTFFVWNNDVAQYFGPNKKTGERQRGASP